MPAEITVEELARLIGSGRPPRLVDVRQPWEHAIAALPGSRLIPLGELPGRTDEIESGAGELVVVYCHHGVRSLSGAAILEQSVQATGGKVASLAGGIDAWSMRIDPGLPRY